MKIITSTINFDELLNSSPCTRSMVANLATSLESDFDTTMCIYLDSISCLVFLFRHFCLCALMCGLILNQWGIKTLCVALIILWLFCLFVFLCVSNNFIPLFAPFSGLLIMGNGYVGSWKVNVQVLVVCLLPFSFLCMKYKLPFLSQSTDADISGESFNSMIINSLERKLLQSLI